MRNRLLLTLCLCACLQAGMAQNSMESIRSRYAAMKEYIATHVGNDPNDGAEWGEYYHLEARQFLPATGGHKEDTYLYWNEREEDAVYPSHYLTFVTTRYNFAAIEYYEEYLYDPDGQIAFIYALHHYYKEEKGESMAYEFRFYFNKGKLLRAIIKKSPCEKNDFKEEYSGTVLSKEYKEVYDGYRAKASEFAELFSNIERHSYNYD